MCLGAKEVHACAQQDSFITEENTGNVNFFLQKI
jgi:hypothetical protein